MASARFKPITLALAASLSLALMGGTALAETRQRKQVLGQVQVSSHQESNLTAEQVQALESDIDRLRTQGRFAEAAKLQHHVLAWREIHNGADHPSTATSLLSLWKVDDTATAAFMQIFYQHLKNREGRAEALARTQAEFRSHPTATWRHPSVWAAFQLTGDWRPIPNL